MTTEEMYADPAPIEAFDFDEIVAFDFVDGDCWYLAGLLHDMTGLPFIAIQAEREVQHVAVELPNSLIVDIEGIWNHSEWLQRWNDISPVDYPEIVYPSDEDAEYDGFGTSVDKYERKGFSRHNLQEIAETIRKAIEPKMSFSIA